jgi:GNAT superfamily N-acetyltransferase
MEQALGVQSMKILPIQFDAKHLALYSVLLKNCFPDTPANRRKFSVDSIVWLYTHNPDGMALGFDAFDEDQLVAHYVCIPANILSASGPMKALLSLNTATLPSYQGRGLFTQLAQATFEAAKQLGFDCAYGVANQNSTTGFVRKLGFSLIAPLQARMGIGRLHSPWSNLPLQFQRIWKPSALIWRCANPANPVRISKQFDTCIFMADTQYKGICAYAELLDNSVFNCSPRFSSLKLKLFLGLLPQGLNESYLKIPEFLKPAPLNFIFKPFQPMVPIPNRDAVHFTFLDFDAY